MAAQCRCGTAMREHADTNDWRRAPSETTLTICKMQQAPDDAEQWQKQLEPDAHGDHHQRHAPRETDKDKEWGEDSPASEGVLPEYIRKTERQDGPERCRNFH